MSDLMETTAFLQSSSAPKPMASSTCEPEMAGFTKNFKLLNRSASRRERSEAVLEACLRLLSGPSVEFQQTSLQIGRKLRGTAEIAFSLLLGEAGEPRRLEIGGNSVRCLDRNRDFDGQLGGQAEPQMDRL